MSEIRTVSRGSITINVIEGMAGNRSIQISIPDMSRVS
jgi:hypothetical protein